MDDVVARVAKRMAEEISDRDFHDPGPEDWLKASRAAVAEIFDALKDVSVDSHNAGEAIQRYGLGHMEIWAAMLEQARKEALGE